MGTSTRNVNPDPGSLEWPHERQHGRSGERAKDDRERKVK
jgi:hypothetical protein